MMILTHVKEWNSSHTCVVIACFCCFVYVPHHRVVYISTVCHSQQAVVAAAAVVAETPILIHHYNESVDKFVGEYTSHTSRMHSIWTTNFEANFGI